MTTDVEIYVGEDSSRIELPKRSYTGFSIVGDIDVIYNGGAIAVEDVSGSIIESGIMIVGTKVTFKLFFRKTPVVEGSEENSTKEISYRVLSIDSNADDINIPATAGGKYIYNLINAAFFDQKMASRGYYDKISSIIEKELQLINTTGFKEGKLIKSTDDIKSRRFLINEKPLTFIKDISMKSIIDSSPAMCFTNEFGFFKLVSINDLIRQTPKASLVPLGSNSTYKYNIAKCNAFEIKLMNSIDSWESSKLKGSWLNLETLKENQNIYADSFIIDNQSRVFIESNISDALTYTNQITFLDEGTLEQKAMIFHARLDTMKTFEIIAEIDNAFDMVSTGDLVEVCISSSSELNESAQNNSYSGAFLVKRCEHRMVKAGQLRSKLTLIKPTTNTTNSIVNKTAKSATTGAAATTAREL